MGENYQKNKEATQYHINSFKYWHTSNVFFILMIISIKPPNVLWAKMAIIKKFTQSQMHAHNENDTNTHTHSGDTVPTVFLHLWRQLFTAWVETKSISEASVITVCTCGSVYIIVVYIANKWHLYLCELWGCALSLTSDIINKCLCPEWIYMCLRLHLPQNCLCAYVLFLHTLK